MVLLRLRVGNLLPHESGHDHGQDGADGDGGEDEVPIADRHVPIAAAEAEHSEVLGDHVNNDHVNKTKRRRTRQHNHQPGGDSASPSLWLLAIGIALLRGQTWARMAGIVIAVISAIINFTWLPYSPWWALMVIGIDVLIIWALASYLRQPEVTSTQPAKTPQTTS